MLEPELAKPNRSKGYDPAEDEKWHQELIKPEQSTVSALKVIFAIFSIPIFVLAFFGLLGLIIIGLSLPGRNSAITNGTKWSEAKTAIGTIKAAVDTYGAKHNGDISSLDEPKGSLKYGFVSGSNLNFKLRLEDLAFENLQYFDAEDFTLEFVTDGKDGLYAIRVYGKEGGGLSGEGREGSITYYSQTGEWEEDY